MLKEKIHLLENEVYELSLARENLTRERKQFGQVKKGMQRQIEQTDAEGNKYFKECEELKKDVEQAEEELDEMKQQRRAVEREIKDLKEGKDNSAN